MDNNSEYISLQGAAKYCDYSQEYLSLRARQGKLKAVKFGRNWITKKDWLEEYLKKVEEYNNNNFGIRKFVAPPENLPVEKLLVPKLRFAFVIALAFVFVASGCVFGKESFKNVYGDLDTIVREFNENFTALASEFNFHFTTLVSEFNENFNQSFAVVSEDINGAISKLGENIATISLPEISLPEVSLPEISLKEWFNSQTEEIVSGVKMIPEIFAEKYFAANEFVERKISQGYKAVTQLWRAPEKIVEEELIPKPAEEGLVVIPLTGKDEEVVKKIKESFSDEVKVEPKDKTSGIIIPIFKEGEGQKYLYILVPVSKEP